MLFLIISRFFLIKASLDIKMGICFLEKKCPRISEIFFLPSPRAKLLITVWDETPCMANIPNVSLYGRTFVFKNGKNFFRLFAKLLHAHFQALRAFEKIIRCKILSSLQTRQFHPCHIVRISFMTFIVLRMFINCSDNVPTTHPKFK